MLSPAAVTLLIFAIAAVLLLSEKLRADLVALLVVVALGATGVLTPRDAFSGFGSSAVVTIAAIFVLAEALRVTGVTDRAAALLLRIGGASEGRLVAVVMLAGAALSLVMNNIAAAAVLLPAISGVASQGRVSPSRLLMPLAFATILGGMATLFTTTNLVVSGLLHGQDIPGFGVLDFLPVGLPVVAAGVAYMALWGRRRLPQAAGMAESSGSVARAPETQPRPAGPAAARPAAAGIAVAILAAALLLAAINTSLIGEIMLGAALLAVIARILTMDQAYAAVEWRSVFLVAGMLPLGLAMGQSGAAAMLANQLVSVLAPLGPMALLAGLFTLAVLLTQMMHGAAVATVVAPIAIQVARQAGLDPRSLAMAVALGTSMAFLTPLGHPVNVLVMGPGGYRFRDYTRVGLPLTLLLFAVIMIALPIFWPLVPR